MYWKPLAISIPSEGSDTGSSKTEEGQRGFERDGIGHLHGGDHDQRWQAIRQHVPKHDAGTAERYRERRLDVVLARSATAAPCAVRAK